MNGRVSLVSLFCRFTAIFHAPGWFGALRLLSVSSRLCKHFTGLRRSNGAGWAAVWWNCPHWHLVCRFLNVDMLIVTFKFLPCLTAHEKHPSLIYRKFRGFEHDFLKSLQFVHDVSPSCIVSTWDFCWWWRWFRRAIFSEMGFNFWGRCCITYGLSIFTYIRAQKTLGAAKTSAYYAVAPFVGAFLSFILLHENLSASYLIALLIMVLGTTLVTADTLIHHHSHEHTHTFTHTHDGTTHTLDELERCIQVNWI